MEREKKREELKRELYEAVKRELGEEYTVQLKEVEKNNGILFPAILSRKRESRTAPIVYIDSILEGMESGNMELWEAAQKIADTCRKNESDKSAEFFGNITKADILGMVRYRLINFKRNEKQLETLPYNSLFDLAAVYEVVLEEGESGTASVLADYRFLNRYSISRKEIDVAAKRNTEKKGFCVWDIATILAEQEGEETVQGHRGGSGRIWVLSNQEGVYGASVMLYEGYFDRLAQEAGSDLYILPSSIHEVLAVEADGLNPEELKAMVKMINDTEVPEDEVLSETVYRYRRGTHQLEAA